MQPKLVSDRFMELLNYHLEQAGRAHGIRKRDFMWLLLMMDRHQRRMIVRQFDELEGISR